LALHVCAREDGIRRSKDLRAEIRKFLNSTNERKKMSTKTMKQRIAVVAASALTAGFLSVVSTPVASAAGGNLGDVTSANICAVANSSGTALTPLAGVYTTPAFLTMAVGQTATIAMANGEQQVRMSNSNALITGVHDLSVLTISQGGLIADGTASSSSFTVTALTAGTVTVKTYDNSADSTAADTITITVVAACGSSAFDYGSSKAELQSSYEAADDLIDDISYVANTATVHLATKLNNAYGQKLPSGLFNVKVSSGAVVGIAGTDVAASCSTLAEANMQDDGEFVNVAVCQATTHVPWTGTITLSYNGTVLLTKSATIRGAAASITASSPKIGKTSDTTYRAFSFKVADSAGNLLGSVTPTVVAGLTNATVQAVVAAASSADDVKTTGNYITCGSSAGELEVQLKTTSATGATILSNKWKATCGGDLDSFKASLDKAVYAPGDIATVTVTGLDAEGKLVYGPGADDSAATSAESTRYVLLSGTTAPVIAGGSMEAVVAPSTADYFSNGVKTYQFKVTATEGSFNLSVNLPDSGAAAVVVPYTVKATSATVSNADVLKSIVSLIASINKQIQALQKLILRR